MNITDVIAGIFKPAAKLIDDVHTSTEEKLALQAELARVKNELMLAVIEYKAAITQAQNKAISAESDGKSWIQRNWRAITMLTFLALIVAHSLGFINIPIAEKIMSLLEIGISGYIENCSAESLTN